MTTGPAPFCQICGAPLSGKFCSACGASSELSRCTGCGNEISPAARFCSHCGSLAGSTPTASRDRTPWLIAGGAVAALMAVLLIMLARGSPDASAQPEVAALQPAGDGLPPDISSMSPRERFNRLYNRVMQAAQSGDEASVSRFTPMALQAYAQLDTVDADARYHAALIRLQTGDATGAHALADTILEQSPNHLFGYIVRGTAATLASDPGARSQADREFLRRYDREMAAGRPEYRDHGPVIEEFRREAVGRTGGQADGNSRP